MSAFDTRGLLAQDDYGEVTPSDSTTYSGEGGFYIEQNETITFEYLKRDKKAGNTRTLSFMAGYHPIRIRRVLASTTLTGKMVVFAA